MLKQPPPAGSVNSARFIPRRFAFQDEIIYLPSGRVVHCYNFKLMTSPGIIFSTQCIIFQFHEKERPVPSNVNRSQEHRFLEGNEKKKKLSPSENVMSCKKIFALFKLYTFSSPFRAFSLRFQSFSDEPIRGSHHPDVSFH